MTGGIRAVKMSGAGNDFLLLLPDQAERLGVGIVEWVRRVCRRGVSIGADGVLCLSAAGAGRVGVRFYNPDGSSAFCGNGTRCAARLALLQGMAGESMVLVTDAGDVPARVEGERVRLTLPPPLDRGEVSLAITGMRRSGRHVIAGVPHWVTFVDDPAAVPLAVWGPAVRRHPLFGVEGTNVDVVGRVAGDAVLHIRTWERGVEAETLACGSGAVAAAFAVRLAGGPSEVRVVPASGIPLDVAFPGSRDAPGAALLEGEARILFEGEIGPEATRDP